MMRLKHCPYSPDLAPSDFHVLPTVNEWLKDIDMVDEEDLFNRLKEILNEIPRREFDKAFEAWINRVMTVSGGDGGYTS
jgi:hypothetical protein